jgi:flagellar L-ring protein precursor FlgH
VASAPKPALTTSATRASWLSNRPVLHVGDIVTVILDEQTNATERNSWTASANRGQAATFSAVADGKSVVGATGFKTGMQSSQQNRGEANRQGDLTGVLSARIVSIEANGVARIEGAKTVTIDGREQQMNLTGSIRLDDVAPSNVVHSSRIADASIQYKGKDVAPKHGIIGKIIAIIWP